MIDSKAAFEKFLDEKFPSAPMADDYEEWRKQMEESFIAGVDWACDKIGEEI